MTNPAVKTLNSRLITIIQRKTLQACISKDFETVEAYALALSVDMKYDRSNISRNLNQLYQDGILIKVQGRPTLYFDKKTICDYFSLEALASSFENAKELKTAVTSRHPADLRSSVTAFNDLIGTKAGESLFELSGAIKKVLIYPASVHGFLLSGEAGTGKTAFLKAILDSEIKLHSLRQEDIRSFDLRFACCRDILKELSSEEAAPSCALFYYPEFCREEELLLFTDLLYHIINGDMPPIISFIIYCGPGPVPERLERETAYFAESICLPPFSERTVKEKILLVLKEIQTQCDLIKKPVEISKICFTNLLSSRYEQNLASLHSEIARACRNAYSNAYPSADVVRIQLDDISARVFNPAKGSDSTLANLNIASSKVNFSTVYFYPSQENLTLEQVKGLSLDKNGDFVKFQPVPFPERLDRGSLSADCELALRGSRAAHEAMKNSKTYQILMSAFPAVNFSEALEGRSSYSIYYGLYAHTASVIEEILSKKYEEPSGSSKESALSAEQEQMVLPVTESFLDVIQKEFGITLPEYEKDWMNLYLSLSGTMQSHTKVQVFILCRWQPITEVYREYADTLTAKNRPSFFTCEAARPDINQKTQYSALIEQIASQYNGKGVIVISDGPLAPELVNLLFRRLDNNVYYVNQISREIIAQAVRFSDDACNTVDDFAHYCSLSINNGRNLALESKISTIVKNIIHDSLTFLDSDKLYSLLYAVLISSQAELHIISNDNLTVRFIVHAAFMVERSVKGESLPYKRAKEFIRNHVFLFSTIRKNMEPLEKHFNMKIADTELAYVSEIFLDYL